MIGAVGAGLALVALANSTHWIGPDSREPKKLSAAQLDALLAANRLNDGENIKAVSLHRGERSATMLVQVREREPNHYHADSDITVFMITGNGVLRAGEQEFDMLAGDIALVPRGMPHYFVNRGATPAAAVVVFAPPPGPKDRIVIQ